MASGLLVWQSSYAAFNATTDNPANNWTAGSVILGDDDGGSTAMFNASALKPGSTAAKCIVVTSTGTVASAVKLYATGYTTSSDTLTPFAEFGTHINLSIQEVSGGGTFASRSGECSALTSTATDFSGTLAAFAATNHTYGTGVSSWAPTGSGTATKTFRVTYTLDSGTPNSAQLGTASAGFTWEAQGS
jgi:hypothetical protein